MARGRLLLLLLFIFWRLRPWCRYCGRSARAHVDDVDAAAAALPAALLAPACGLLDVARSLERRTIREAKLATDSHGDQLELSRRAGLSGAHASRATGTEGAYSRARRRGLRRARELRHLLRISMPRSCVPSPPRPSLWAWLAGAARPVWGCQRSLRWSPAPAPGGVFAFGWRGRHPRVVGWGWLGSWFASARCARCRLAGVGCRLGALPCSPPPGWRVPPPAWFRLPLAVGLRLRWVLFRRL